MNRKEFLRLIRESRGLLKTATPEQKVRLLKLIRESYRQVKNQPRVITETKKPTPDASNNDYLDEK